MRTVIEAGRHASPLVNNGLTEIGSKLESFRQLVSDLSSVKSDMARDAVIGECVRIVDSLSGSLANTVSIWSEFNSSLMSYRYKFGRKKKPKMVDLPGQQVLFDEPTDDEARKDGTESR